MTTEDSELTWFRSRLHAYHAGLLSELELGRFRTIADRNTECARLLREFEDESGSDSRSLEIHIPSSILGRWPQAQEQLIGLERRLYAQHLEQCEECRAALELLGYPAELEIDDVSVPRSSDSDGRHEHRDQQNPFPLGRVWWVAAAAALLLVAVVRFPVETERQFELAAYKPGSTPDFQMRVYEATRGNGPLDAELFQRRHEIIEVLLTVDDPPSAGGFLELIFEESGELKPLIRHPLEPVDRQTIIKLKAPSDGWINGTYRLVIRPNIQSPPSFEGRFQVEVHE